MLTGIAMFCSVATTSNKVVSAVTITTNSKVVSAITTGIKVVSSVTAKDQVTWER